MPRNFVLHFLLRAAGAAMFAAAGIPGHEPPVSDPSGSDVSRHATAPSALHGHPRSNAMPDDNAQAESYDRSHYSWVSGSSQLSKSLIERADSPVSPSFTSTASASQSYFDATHPTKSQPADAPSPEQQQP